MRNGNIHVSRLGTLHVRQNFHICKQSRAIVLNRFGLALIGRIAPDRSDAEYVRRTRSTKRLRTIVLLCRTGNKGTQYPAPLFFSSSDPFFYFF